MSVYVLDKKGKPLMPCSEKRAKLLLNKGRACVVRVIPFIIRIKDRLVTDCELQPVQLKCDPGSATTGLALVRKTQQLDPVTSASTTTLHVLSLMELVHRGRAISEALTQRRAFRRNRRARKTRYRQARFLNRKNQQAGWLAPSLQHRVDMILNWVHKLRQWVPITSLAQELVSFDTQKMQNPSIQGQAYQRGTLFEQEVRAYVLARDNYACVYCDKKGVPFNLDHVAPRSKGGSNRVSNLVCACISCNIAKDNLSLSDFLKDDPLRLKKVQSQLKVSLKDAAAVNSTKLALLKKLQETGLLVVTSSGAVTAWNRKQLGLPKTHALDALCVDSVQAVTDWQQPTLQIKSVGRGRYARTLLDQYGFPRGYLMKAKKVKGFQSGDRIKATVTKGKKVGIYVGKVAVRVTGAFNIQTQAGLIQGIGWKACQLIQRADGYQYNQIAH